MDITLTLPTHVAAAFADEDEAKTWLLAQATDHARRQAAVAASDAAQALIREAVAPFDGVEPPVTPTAAERIAAVETDQTALRGQVREVGVILASAAGVPEKDAVAMIDQALGK